MSEIENNNNISEAERVYNTKTINQCLSAKLLFMIFLIIENQNNVIKKTMNVCHFQSLNVLCFK